MAKHTSVKDPTLDASTVRLPDLAERALIETNVHPA